MKVTFLLFLVFGLANTVFSEEYQDIAVLSAPVTPIFGGNIGVPPLEVNIEMQCECALFTSTFSEFEKPLVSRGLMNVNCDADGEQRCLKTCATLAEVGRSYGPQITCVVVENSNELKVSVHSRSCYSQKWIYTGVTSTSSFCCQQHRVVDCAELDKPMMM